MNVKYKEKLIFGALGFLFIAAILIWSAVFQSGAASIFSNVSDQDAVKVVFFDVGQGSSVFIEAANKNQILIDGGPGSQVLNKLGKEMPFFDRSIDVIILTHPDADHLNGLVDVLKKYKVYQVVDSCIEDSNGAYQEWLRLIEEKKIERLCAKAGQKIKLDERAEIDILFPLQSLKEVSVENTNNASLVMRLINGSSTILLTGDAEEATEHQLINSNINLKSQVLQVAHHGSKSSSSGKFLELVAPETAVIQVGKNNRYKHPHQEVIDRLKNAKIFRTDLDGDVEFLCGLEKCEAMR